MITTFSTKTMLGRLLLSPGLSSTRQISSFLPSLGSPIFTKALTPRISSLNPSPIQSQVRAYKLKTNSSYKLRFRKSKSTQSDFIKRGYTMHGHKRTGERHGVHLKRAGDAPLAKGYAKLIEKKLAPR